MINFKVCLFQELDHLKVETLKLKKKIYILEEEVVFEQSYTISNLIVSGRRESNLSRHV